MNSNRLISLALVGAMLVIAVLGWLVGVSPLLTQAGGVETQRQSLAAVNDANEIRLAGLKAQFKKMDEMNAELVALRRAIPTNAYMPAFLRTINAYTAQFAVELMSVSVTTPVAFVPVTTTGEPAPDSTAVVAPDEATPSLARLIPMTIVVTGEYGNVMAFVGAIQASERLFLMSGVALTTTKDGVTTASMDGGAFALPLTDSQQEEKEAEELAALTPTPTPAPTNTAGP